MSIASNRSVFAIVLAAGTAARFGVPKQLAQLHGVPLVRRASELVASCFPSRNVLVAGHEWRAVLGACAPLPGYLVINDSYDDGMGTSIATAVRTLQHTADAIIVLLADQPLITAAHLASLAAAWSGAEQEIVATRYAGMNGAPTLFARGCFASLMALTGDQGARALLADPRFTLRQVTFEDAAVDIDTPGDLASLESSVRS